MNALFLFALLFADPSIIRIRDLYYSASENKKAIAEFAGAVSSASSENALLTGYKGMSYMVRAKHSMNPYHKMDFFSKGRDFLEGAIMKDPNEIELRFLRYSVQSNAPGFLRYSGNLEEDKKHLMDGYKQLDDEDLKVRISRYMLQYCKCSDSEKNVFK